MVKILIIEDDKYINNLIKTLLIKEGFEVISAFSGTEGELRLKMERIDLIICDLMLPGLSGAGKTTLMKLIAGHAKLSFGKIELFGNTDIKNERSRIGTLIEEPGLLRNLTAAQNLEYFRLQFGILGKENVNKILKEVGLEAAGNKKCKNFSVGMKQRLGIGIALLGTPEFLILDEPINGLDPAGIIKFRNILLDINIDLLL